MAGNRNVTINNSAANPNPAPISKGGGNNQLTQLTFQVPNGDSNTYTLSGLNGALNAPSTVDVSNTSSAGPYSVNSSVSPPVNGQSFTYGIAIKTSQYEDVGDGSAQIQVDP